MPTFNKNYFYLSQDLYGKNVTVKVNNQVIRLQPR